ncbi:carboxymuconolactone decarboxylase family protein [Streptomyces sp. V4-01]|uniref:Carboxymuconolactone decarboxylase family protein n=1 Tax=Actinacidiphila polyblastidii TaxID=3110430 RepID=A0ABU7PHY0_9ACTN|nr:carboxymuconolactone decarboxylase family protein [Streptomyces sp. V4-01]
MSARPTPGPDPDPGLQAAMVRAPLDRDAGYRLLAELAGPATVEGTLTGLDALAPGFPDWIVTALFGGTYQREGLALRDRQIATLAALTALGGVEPQLDDHVRNSLRIGVEPREITEVMVHLAPYVGVPKALAGLRVAAAVFRDVTPSASAGVDGADGASEAADDGDAEAGPAAGGAR